MGAPRDWYRAQQYERQTLNVFRLYPEHVEAFRLVGELRTQRNYTSGMNGGVLLGFKYEGIIPVLRLKYSKKKTRRLFEEIQLIEQGMVERNEQNRVST